MELKDLLGKPIDQMSTEELTKSIAELRKLRPSQLDKPTTVGKKPKVIKSNQSKRHDDLISKLTPEQLAILQEKLGIGG